MRAHVGSVEMVTHVERDRALESTRALLDLEGNACAEPPSVDARLAHRHPRLWVGSVHATCPAAFNTEEVCRLTVSYSATSGSEEGLPASLSVDLASRTPTQADWMFAAGALSIAPVDEDATAMAHASVGILAARPSLGTSLQGHSLEIASEDVDVALAQVSHAVGACRDLDVSVPRGIDARIEVGPSGQVVALRLDEERVTGLRRRACVEGALRTLRFPSSLAPSREVSVYGNFGWNTPSNTQARVRSVDSHAGGVTGDPRVLERIQACVGTETEVRMINASVHIQPNGVASHVQSDASDATTTCLQNALIGSVWPCSGERDVALRLCAGNPLAPPEPVRP